MLQSLHWLTRDLSGMPESEDWLSEGERSRLAGMRFPKRRNDWMLGRWTAKCAIRASRLVEIPRDSILEICTAGDGAPEPFLDEELLKIPLSISHSHGRSLCTVGPVNFRIGCDLEFVEPREHIFLQDYFTREECLLVEQSGDPLLYSIMIWSAKESALKILREGLRLDTRSVNIQCADVAPVSGTWYSWTGHSLQSSDTFYGWWQSCDGFIYTLAADQPNALPNELRT
jgi:4'-phosphopantetheinyl transferase